MSGKERFYIRPSQVTRTFGPGSIYDNEHDSVMIMGLDHWDQEKFKPIRDEMLLQEIGKSLDGIKYLVSTSSFKDHEDPGKIPVKSFPSWGFCPKCNKLVPYRNNKNNNNMRCDSEECQEHAKNNGTKTPKTYPVRFVAACENGHLDEFPWYLWVHRTEGQRSACTRNDANLFLVSNSKSVSLESKTVVCKECGTEQSMSNSLSINGLRSVISGCTKKRPWLDTSSKKCDGQMRGIFKGSTSMYFPLVKSAVTIPPFSDRLAEKIIAAGQSILKQRKGNDKAGYENYLQNEFELRPKYPNGKWSLEEALDKIAKIEQFSKHNSDKDIHVLEFDALNSGNCLNDDEFITEALTLDGIGARNHVEKVVLVKKMRIVSSITGFTRISPFDHGDETRRISHISKEKLTWLPAMENRGEGIFFRMNNAALTQWGSKTSTRDRFGKIMTIQGKNMVVSGEYRHDPKYLFLHTFSHAIMRSMAKFAGYSIASLTERIYCGTDMSGVLIYTASPSSDGSMGGLTGLGHAGKIWEILDDAISQSARCSCDPLCSMQDAEKIPQLIGSSCHACTLLPETCCESMNVLLDRGMVNYTLRSDMGFLGSNDDYQNQ